MSHATLNPLTSQNSLIFNDQRKFIASETLCIKQR